MNIKTNGHFILALVHAPTINISSTPATNLATNTTYYIDAQGNYTTEQPAGYVATYICTGNNNNHGNQGTVDHE